MSERTTSPTVTGRSCQGSEYGGGGGAGGEASGMASLVDGGGATAPPVSALASLGLTLIETPKERESSSGFNDSTGITRHLHAHHPLHLCDYQQRVSTYVRRDGVI